MGQLTSLCHSVSICKKSVVTDPPPQLRLGGALHESVQASSALALLTLDQIDHYGMLAASLASTPQIPTVSSARMSPEVAKCPMEEAKFPSSPRVLHEIQFYKCYGKALGDCCCFEEKLL